MSLDGWVFVAVISTVLRFTVRALFSFMIVPVVCLHDIKHTHVITEGDKQTRLCNTPFRSAHDATQCQKDYSRVLDSREGFGLSRCHL